MTCDLEGSAGAGCEDSQGSSQPVPGSSQDEYQVPGNLQQVFQDLRQREPVTWRVQLVQGVRILRDLLNLSRLDPRMSLRFLGFTSRPSRSSGRGSL